MRLSDIIKHTKKFFEKKRKNPIQLENDSNLESNLKFLKVSDKSTPLQISDDTINVQGSLTVNGASVSTEPDDDSAVVTALNSATENELVTVGATTTELDAEANLTFDGDHLSIAATGKIFFDGGSDTYIIESSADVLDFIVGGVNMIRITEASADVITLGGGVSVPATKRIGFDGALTGTYISESSADVLDIYVGADKMLTLDEANDKISMGATNWVAGTVSGGTVTEFSAANSAYAGMILGYTDIGLNESHTLLSLTTSFVVPTDEFSVSFVAPPSGNVEIQCQIQHGFGSSGVGDLVAGLSTANATSGYSQLADFHEKTVNDVGPRGGITTIQISWTLTGLTAGTAYERWVGFKTPTTSGSPFIQWGGNASGRYPDFIMKAIALPATITT